MTCIVTVLFTITYGIMVALPIQGDSGRNNVSKVFTDWHTVLISKLKMQSPHSLRGHTTLHKVEAMVGFPPPTKETANLQNLLPIQV